MTSKLSVLIADDDADMVRVLAIKCRVLGLAVDTAENGVNAILKAKKSPPDLMIVDLGMPEADGFKVCDRLQELDLVCPVVVLTGRSDDESKSRVSELGAHYVFKDSDMWTRLEPMILEFLNISRPASLDNNTVQALNEETEVLGGAPTVLTVDDDPAITKAIKIRLQPYGVEVLEASNGQRGFDIALKHAPDVIITDYSMPEGSGDHLLIRLGQTDRTKSIPVIVLTGQTFNDETDVALRRDVLGRRGAVAYLAKPLDFDHLLAELEQHIVLEASTAPVAKAI